MLLAPSVAAGPRQDEPQDGPHLTAHTEHDCDTADIDGRSGGPPAKAARRWDDSSDDTSYEEVVYSTLK